MPSIDDDRRALLAGLAGLVGLSGCLDAGETPTPTGATTPEPTHPETEPPVTGRLSLTPVDPTETDAPMTVFPDDLLGWLRRAVTDETTVRAHGSGYVYPAVQEYEPVPPLAGLNRVRIDDPESSITGGYDLDADGGVRYERVVGAEEASPPKDADVTAVPELSGERRELVLAAIGAETDRDRRVYPETDLGSWVRTEFFGGYVRHDGTIYRGREIRQTDAAFSATEIWYVLSVSSSDAERATVTLDLKRPGARVRSLVDDLRDDHETVERMERDVAGRNAVAAETLSAEHPFLLTHDAVYETTFVY